MHRSSHRGRSLGTQYEQKSSVVNLYVLFATVDSGFDTDLNDDPNLYNNNTYLWILLRLSLNSMRSTTTKTTTVIMLLIQFGTSTTPNTTTITNTNMTTTTTTMKCHLRFANVPKHVDLEIRSNNHRNLTIRINRTTVQQHRLQ
jgi:hypothetical protein